MISVGDAVLKLGVDTKSLDAGMKGIGNTIKKHQKAIGIGMTAAGGAILAAGALSIKTFAEMGDEVQKMALKTGFSTEALSELRHAAEISGTSIQGIEKGVKRMASTLLDAEMGLATSVDALNELNLTVEDFKGLGPEEAFNKFMEAIADVEDPLKRSALAQDIFGKSGVDLLPIMADGSQGLADLRKEAHDLGIVFDQEAANKAAEFTDSMHRMDEATSGVKMAIAEQLIPVLMPLIDKITAIIKQVSAWAKEHPTLTKVLVIGTTAFGALLVVLGGLILVMPGLTAALGAFGITLHLALGPIALVTLAIAGLVAAGILLWKNWDKVRFWLEMTWTDIKILFLKGVQNILDSLSQFTKFIPGLNKIIDSAKDKLTNMIEVEKVKKNLLEVENAMKATEAALDDNAAAIEENITVMEEYDEALLEEQEALVATNEQLTEQVSVLKELQRQYEANEDTVNRAIQQMEYEESAAGKLGLTVDDLIVALTKMGWESKDITKVLYDLGEEGNNVNAIMEATGITSLEVADILGIQTEAVDKLKESYNEAGEAAKSFSGGISGMLSGGRVEPTIGPGGGPRFGLGLTEKIAASGDLINAIMEAQGATKAEVISGIQQGAFGFGTPGTQASEGVLEEVADAMGFEPFQHGGIAMRPMLASVAEKSPEAVIPLDKLEGMLGGKAVNIYVELDGRVIGRAIGQPLVDEIRLRTGVRI